MSDVGAIAGGQEIDESRRKFLTVATSATAAVGAVLAAVPFVESWEPSERARALGAPVVVDISKLEIGQMITATWRKQVIYIVGRAQTLVDKLSAERRHLKDPKSQGFDAADICPERDALAARRGAGADRHLHAPGLPAQAILRSG